MADRRSPDNETGLLLRDVAKFVQRFVYFPTRGQETAVALWVLHTHAIDAAQVTPYLAILAPGKRMGKTRLLEVMKPLVLRPELVMSPSDAAMYSDDPKALPTLLLDEVDAIFGPKAREHETLRGLLNAGFERGAVVPRVVVAGSNRYKVYLPVFYPKALAGIDRPGGTLPDTVMDRSIPIRLKRKKRGEAEAERFRRQKKDEAKELRQRIEAWATANVDKLKDAEPDLPDVLNDRAQDGWEPLLAIADLAGEFWATRARKVAVLLHTGDQEQTEGELLLHHVHEIFDHLEVDALSSYQLLSALCDRDDGPWAARWAKQVEKAETIGPGYDLNRLLKPYGIGSKKISLNDQVIRGYKRAWFEDAWSRYL
jgi:hypothetical protein